MSAEGGSTFRDLTGAVVVQEFTQLNETPDMIMCSKKLSRRLAHLE